MKKVIRPKIVKKDHLLYLDLLRESGVTNMFGAGEYLERDFDMSEKDAREILVYWMKTFVARGKRRK